jgi:hypothetical protein
MDVSVDTDHRWLCITWVKYLVGLQLWK